MYMLLVATARSSSADNAICYVLAVLWMTVSRQVAPGTESAIVDCFVVTGFLQALTGPHGST